MIRRTLAALALIAVTAGPAAALQPSGTPPASGASQPKGVDNGEWQTVSELPESEKLPAAPLLVGAYAIIWIVPMFYLWSIWRRLNTVEREMKDLERRAGAR